MIGDRRRIKRRRRREFAIERIPFERETLRLWIDMNHSEFWFYLECCGSLDFRIYIYGNNITVEKKKKNYCPYLEKIKTYNYKLTIFSDKNLFFFFGHNSDKNLMKTRFILCVGRPF